MSIIRNFKENGRTLQDILEEALIRYYNTTFGNDDNK